MDKVVVHCHLPRGVQLRLFDQHSAPTEPMRETGRFALHAGENLVDADFANAWFEQNRNSELFLSGNISLIDKKEI